MALHKPCATVRSILKGSILPHPHGHCTIDERGTFIWITIILPSQNYLVALSIQWDNIQRVHKLAAAGFPNLFTSTLSKQTSLLTVIGRVPTSMPFSHQSPPHSHHMECPNYPPHWEFIFNDHFFQKSVTDYCIPKKSLLPLCSELTYLTMSIYVWVILLSFCLHVSYLSN